MTKAKKKPARKRSTKPADTTIVEKRAKAYAEMEPQLCDCVRWAELAETLSLDHERSHYDMVVRHLAEKMEELRANYYAPEGFEL